MDIGINDCDQITLSMDNNRTAHILYHQLIFYPLISNFTHRCVIVN